MNESCCYKQLVRVNNIKSIGICLGIYLFEYIILVLVRTVAWDPVTLTRTSYPMVSNGIVCACKGVGMVRVLLLSPSSFRAGVGEVLVGSSLRYITSGSHI
jgi:hypothetical protein